MLFCIVNIAKCILKKFGKRFPSYVFQGDYDCSATLGPRRWFQRDLHPFGIPRSSDALAPDGGRWSLNGASNLPFDRREVLARALKLKAERRGLWFQFPFNGRRNMSQTISSLKVLAHQAVMLCQTKGVRLVDGEGGFVSYAKLFKIATLGVKSPCT